MIRIGVEMENLTIGIGLNFDTALKIGNEGVKMELFGFGFRAGNDRVGFKLPFFDMEFII